MMPTTDEIIRAKNYILLRLEAERVAVSSVDAALLAAAKRIVEISHRYNIPPESFRFSADPKLQAEVRDVLALLRDAIYSRISEIDTFKDEDEGEVFVAPILTRENHGKTLRERIAEYASRWGYEVEAVIAAAGLEGIRDTAKIYSGIKEYADNPYDNPWVKKHTGEGEVVRLDNIPHYGKGRAIATKAAFSALATDVVAKGWMWNWGRLNAGAIGYFVYRASSIPCEICDAQVGFLHDMSDELGKPPYHNNCKCYIVYVDSL